MTSVETILFWLATLTIAATFFAALLARVLGKDRPRRLANVLFAAAVLPLLTFGVVRWVQTGHPPFVTMFESMTFSVLLLVAFYNLILWKKSGTAVALAPVSGFSLLLMGWSMTLPHEASPLSAALDNVWLFIHASFATAGAAMFLVAAGFGAAFLLGPQKLAKLGVPGGESADMKKIPQSIATYLLLGFIMWGTMIASGAIWAEVAWGRYWAWDPVELWSLISWIFYALLLHARMTFRMSPRLFCTLAIVTAVVVAFSLWGIQYVYETIHTYG
jgi:ABC-type transport system involved in cytochrome c biogenesis permease subunit